MELTGPEQAYAQLSAEEIYMAHRSALVELLADCPVVKGMKRYLNAFIIGADPDERGHKPSDLTVLVNGPLATHQICEIIEQYLHNATGLPVTVAIQKDLSAFR